RTIDAGATSDRGLQRIDDLTSGHSLAQVAAHTDVHERADVARVLIARHHHNGDLGRFRAHTPRHFKATHIGEVQVQQQDVRPSLIHDAQGLTTISGGIYHLDVTAALQRGTGAFTYQRVIVDYHDLNAATRINHPTSPHQP